MPSSAFTPVMATGIVSLAAHGSGLLVCGEVLFALNVLLFVVLVALSLARAWSHWESMCGDFRSHQRAPGFNAFIAGTCVLGVQSIHLAGYTRVGFGLWGLAILLWLGVTYWMLPLLMAGESKPPLTEAIHGGWLLFVVSSQALALLGCELARWSHGGNRIFLFVSLLFFLIGSMQYVLLLSVIFLRCVFLPMSAKELLPSYWINMGAGAITALAASQIYRLSDELPISKEIRSVLVAFGLLCWAQSSWWIPVLLALGIWRHAGGRHALDYEYGFWSAVFPLGMYSACTLSVSRHFELPFLTPLATAFAWIALLTWGITFVGLLRSLATPASPPTSLGDDPG